MTEELQETKELNPEEQVGQLIDLAVNEFLSSTKMKSIRFNIECTDDIYGRRLELATNEKDSECIRQYKTFIQDLNGTVVFPKDKDGIHYVLISEKDFQDRRYPFIDTIIHELTHIYDLMNFATEFCGGSYELVEQHGLFKDFYYWTEFHAKHVGYSLYRKILYQFYDIKFNKEDQLGYILNTELKDRYDELLQNLKEHQYDKDITICIYSIIQFLGRFSVWQDLFQEITPHWYLPDYFQGNYRALVIGIYKLLCSMDDYGIAISKLNQLEMLLKLLKFNHPQHPIV